MGMPKLRLSARRGPGAFINSTHLLVPGPMQRRSAWAPRKLLDRLRASLRQKAPALCFAFARVLRLSFGLSLPPNFTSPFLYRCLAAAYSRILVFSSRSMVLRRGGAYSYH